MGHAQAVQIRDMNTANVMVVGRSEKSLQEALKTAFNQVLVKMSGNTSVGTVPAVLNAQSRIKSLVISYSYSAQKNVSGNSELILHVVFDPAGLKHVLKSAGQAIWGSDRPLTLIWLSVPEGIQTNVISSDDSSSLAVSISRAAERRGVPVIFPTMDLQDQADAALMPRQLPSNQQLTTSARRYGVQSVLAGTIVSDNGQAQGEWKLFLNDTPYEWQTSGASIKQVANNGLQQAADMMANQLATINSKSLQSVVMLQISGVENLDDYVHVVAALRRLTVVSKVTVNDMNNNTLLLQVRATSDVDSLVNALRAVNHLTTQAAPSDAGPSQTNLFYHWQSSQAQNDSSQPVQPASESASESVNQLTNNNGSGNND